MAIDYDKLLALKIPDAEHSLHRQGHDALRARRRPRPRSARREQLDFVYEKNLKALPTFAAVLGYPGFWVRDLDTGIDWVKIVNGEQGVMLHRR